jgi:hypothetical protein
MSRNNHDISEEKLKELQRREALSDSDEYDIHDKTYESAPLTRQYVKDDIVAKGSELVDDDGAVLRNGNVKHGDRIIDDEEDEDIIIIEEQPIVNIPPVEDINDKYTKKQPTKPIFADDEEEPEVKKTEPKLPAVKPKKEKKKEPKSENALAKKNFDHQDYNRDYIDRENTIYNDDQKFEKFEKSKKEKKPVNLSWLKPVVSILAIILSIILAVVLFFFIKGFTSDKQELSPEKSEYIKLVEMTNDAMLVENTISKEFLATTEQFVIDAMSKENYILRLESMYDELNSEILQYSDSRFEYVKDYEIKSLSLEYLRITLKAVESILDIKDQDSMEMKTYILSNVNEQMGSREIQYKNLLALMNETSAKYKIESELQENIIYFNVTMS